MRASACGAGDGAATARRACGAVSRSSDASGGKLVLRRLRFLSFAVVASVVHLAASLFSRMYALSVDAAEEAMLCVSQLSGSRRILARVAHLSCLVLSKDTMRPVCVL